MSTIEKGYKIPSHLGTSYILVEGNGTPAQNAIELQAAVDKSYGLSGYGNFPFTILVMPGFYEFATSTYLDIENPLTISSITGDPDVYISVNGQTSSTVSILVNSDGVTAIGLSTSCRFSVGNAWDTKIINCVGGQYSFNYDDSGSINCNIYYENCIGGDFSFGASSSYDVTIMGSYINCTAGNYSFGFSDVSVTNYATFKNCVAVNNSFCCSSNVYEYYGYFYNCKATDYSFDYPYSSMNGPNVTFKNCVGNLDCFSPFGVLNGIMINCIQLGTSFGTRTYGTGTSCYVLDSVDTSGVYNYG